MERVSAAKHQRSDESEAFSVPVDIFVHSVRKREADPDGICAKAVIDGIVKAGVLIDDKSQYVNQVSYSQEKGDDEKTYIILEPATATAYEKYLKALLS